MKLLCAEFAEDGDRGRGADTVCAGFEHGADVGEGADAAGGFDSATRTSDTAQERNIGGCCAASGKSRRGFEKICAGLDGDLGGAKLFFDREQAGFEDDLEDGAVVMGDGGCSLDGVMDGLMVSTFKLADGENHVDFSCAETSYRGRFVAEGGD